ncbi:MAG: hypothetical protein M1826_000871 [Phylliscum demangeonii]|nr:MAG: hypothetical protein M1826_000871 [Phylliscum demangeonii]
MPSNFIYQDLYCALCGSPLSSEEDADHVLYQEEEDERDDDGMRLPYSGPWVITPDEMEIEVYHHDAGGYAYFPLHNACLSIAERVFERRRRNGPGPKPTSPEGLYDGINRQSRDSESTHVVACAVNWPHGCYGAQALQGESWDWMPDDGTEVPGLTTFILAHLQPVTAEEEEEDVVAANSNKSSPPPPSLLEGLPTELLDRTEFFLPFADTLALSRTSTRLHRRLLTQTWWRKALIAGDAVGYLWDLDPGLCRSKDTDPDATDKPWDWRALARQFATRNCFDDTHNGFNDAPRGLRNRQRIWKILVDV